LPRGSPRSALSNRRPFSNAVAADPSTDSFAPRPRGGTSGGAYQSPIAPAV
jgi:hypothetical protein